MKIKYLIIPILIILLIFPRPTYAQFGIFDYFDAALGGVEEAAGPTFTALLKIFIAYVVGLIAINVSASLLQIVTEHQDWLTVNNKMVSAGWHFSAGIVNMVLIVLAVFIALTIILKIETFEGKKAFIRLVLVALLLNFSLVFIGMLIDASNFIFNAILTGNENLPFQIINKFSENAGLVLASLITTLVAFAVAGIIPFIAPFVQLAFFLGVVTMAFLPMFLMWFFQIFCFFAISGMFFTYAFLFAARVFIIQLLAILSPFAALFLILPQTKKHWDEWLKHLFEWIFFGIALYLFLVVGLKAADALMPTLDFNLPTAGLGTIQQALTGTFVYYFFLFIYLVVAIWISKKYMPTLAAAVIAQGAALGGMMWSQGLKLGQTSYKGLREQAQKPGGPEDRFRRKMEQTRFAGMVGGPGRMDEIQAKRTAEAKEKLKGKTDLALQQSLQRARPGSERAAVTASLLERGKFKPANVADAQRFISEAQTNNANLKEAFKKQPEYAQYATKPDPTNPTGPPIPMTIREVVEKEQPGEFRRNTDTDSLKVPEVLAYLDERKQKEIERNGSSSQKQSMRGVVMDPTQRAVLFNTIWNDFQNGRITVQEYAKAHNEMLKLVSNPTFH